MSTTTTTTEHATIARTARSRGYEATTDGAVFVHCPLCRDQVHADPVLIAGRAGSSDVAFPALDAAMLAHLRGVHA